MNFSYFKRNQTKPILLVKPKAKISKYWSFAINAYPESGHKVFRSVRFSLQNIIFVRMLSNECEDIPTPVYN
jgi:hypothetical protein